MRKLGFSLLGLLCVVNVDAAVIGKEVDYLADGVQLKGYIAYDDAVKSARPAVIVVHEWWGHDAYARKRADMLAAEGYTALALDMYGEGKHAHHPDDAGKMSGEVRKNFPVALSRFNAAVDLLKKHPSVDAKHVAAIGYCFGGGIVLEMARRGVPLDAVVSFHGNLTPIEAAKPGAVKAKILVHNGGSDPFVKPEQIDQFKQEMSNAKANFEFVSYPDAVHSFTNPDADKYGKQFNLPLAYQEAADKKSWAKTMDFFKGVFGR